MKNTIRLLGMAASAVAMTSAFVPVSAAMAAEAVQLSMPAQPLASALRKLGSRTRTNIVFNPATVAGRYAPALNGTHSPAEAVNLLLQPSGLIAKQTSESSFIVVVDDSAPRVRPISQNISPVAANEAAPAVQESAAPAAQLEDIVVTAQKRSENIQRVPIAITAVTAQALKTKGVENAFDLNAVVPALNIQRNVSSPVIYTRGVGLISATPGNENTTAIYVDGVYYMQPIATVFSLSNIERIEVLKGPQGTLFGRNATGGLISIVTPKPKHETSGNLNASYGNYDTVTASGYLTTGLSEKVAADLAFYVSNQGKGWGRNLVTGSEVYKREESSLRAKILFTPSEDWEITLAGNCSFADDDIGVAKQPLRGATVLGGSTAPASIWDVALPVDSFARTRNFGGSLRVEHSLGWAEFLSLSAYQKSSNHSLFDQIGGRTVQAILRYDQPAEWWTQELQLQSPSGNDVKWIAGLFYLGANAGYTPLSLGTSQTGPFSDRVARQGTQSFSAYAQTTFPIFEATNLTLGVRGTYDRRTGKGFVRSPAGVISNVADLRQSWTRPTWRVALDHRFAPDVTGYVSYSRGFKGGVYNPTALSPTAKPVNPETLDDFEGGLKSELFNGRLRLNLAGFYYIYKDQQLQVSLLGQQQFLNAAKSHMYGGEIEASAKLSDHLNVQAGLSLLHAKYSEFLSAPCTTPKPGGGNTLTTCNAKGNDMLRAPHATLNASADYRIPLGDGSLIASVNYYYNDGYFGDSTERVRQPHYDLVNAQLAYKDPTGQWELKGWVRNLFKTEYYTFLSTGTTGDTGTPGAPRTYGATLSYKF